MRYRFGQMRASDGTNAGLQRSLCSSGTALPTLAKFVGRSSGLDRFGQTSMDRAPVSSVPDVKLVGPPGLEPGTKGFALPAVSGSADYLFTLAAATRDDDGVRDALACHQGPSRAQCVACAAPR